MVISRVKTGIGNLDPLINGGFKKNSTNLVAGGTGTGKTIFAIQFLMEGLKEQSYIVYPEGGNSYSEEIRPLKKGMIKLAFDQKVPVVVILKSGVTKLQEVQKDIVIGYRNCGILDPVNYGTWEELRDAIHTKMIEDKKILDQEVARESNTALNASVA